jgi:hypothetical protein
MEQSLKIRREIGDKSGMIATLHNMAHIAKQAKDLEKGSVPVVRSPFPCNGNKGCNGDV